MTAIDKLTSEFETAKLDKYGKAVAKHVLKALCDFCDQSQEFSQAVMQSDKTISDCIASVVKGVGSYISDLDAYNRAATFYFPGAKAHMSLTIDVGDEGFSNKPEDKPITVSSRSVELSLDNLMDF